MNALVLGGTRFIGRQLVEELLSAGHRVTIFNRGQLDTFDDRVERLVGDRRSARDLQAALSGREFDAAYDFLSYEAADARLAVESMAGRVGRFIHISTCSVYWCTGDFPCPVPEEDFDRLRISPNDPAASNTTMRYNKRKAEETLLAAHREYGFPVTTIRMPIVGGEGDLSLRYAAYCGRVGDGGPLALPDGGYAPFRHVYVRDVAQAPCPPARFPAGHRAGLQSRLLRNPLGAVDIAAIAGLLGRRVTSVDIPTPVLRAMGLGTAFSRSPSRRRRCRPSTRRVAISAGRRRHMPCGWNEPFAGRWTRSARGRAAAGLHFPRARARGDRTLPGIDLQPARRGRDILGDPGMIRMAVRKRATFPSRAE